MRKKRVGTYCGVKRQLEELSHHEENGCQKSLGPSFQVRKKFHRKDRTELKEGRWGNKRRKEGREREKLSKAFPMS